jgi:hypothetical protein
MSTPKPGRASANAARYQQAQAKQSKQKYAEHRQRYGRQYQEKRGKPPSAESTKADQQG